MKTNIYFILLLCMFSIFTLQSCQQDPAFPDPGFDIGDQRVTVRKDTTDHYDIAAKMNVPNGVKNIQLIDGVSYKLLNDIHDYDGQKSFNFKYRVDLASFEKDTVLNYVIKVIDKDNRSFNRGIRIDVKSKSHPQIELVGGTNLAVTAPAYIFKGLVTTGLNTIQSIRIVFEGVEKYSYVAPSDVKESEKIIKQLVFFGNMLPDTTYYLRIIITDDKGQESTTVVSVKKALAQKKPVRINFLSTSGSIYRMAFTYNANQQVSQMDYKFPNGIINRYKFHYNANEMVDTLSSVNYDATGVLTDVRKIYFNYVKGSKNLSSIQNQSFTYTNDQISAFTAVSTESNNYVYTTTGRVSSFNRSGTVANVTYVDPFGLGENVFAEYWQTFSYMTISKNRQIRTEFDPIFMPSYMPGWPPFGFFNGTLGPCNDLFWHQYIMTKTIHSSALYINPSTYLDEPTYSYETDEDGNITKLIKTYIGGTSAQKGKNEIYSFFYE